MLPSRRAPSPCCLAVAFDVEAAFGLDVGRPFGEDEAQTETVGAAIVARHQEKLGAVAGGQQQGFGDLIGRHQTAQEILGVRAAVGHPLAQLDGGRAMVDADQQ